MPLLLSLGLLAYFALCGRAVFSLFQVRLGHTRTWLLSPALGIALNVLLVMVLNQAGHPVGDFARPLTAGLGLLVLIPVVRGRGLGARGLAPFGAIALIPLIIGAWPMMKYGYQWMSFGNDDMTNYCLAAKRMLQNGFYRVPQFSELAGDDYTQYYWFQHVANLMRPGSELVLAQMAGVTGRPPSEIFMPLIFSFSLAQLWSLGALLLNVPRRRILALLSCCLLAILPLWLYGTLHQLIAQVDGICALLVALTLTARSRFPRGWSGRLRLAAVIALSLFGITSLYPEVIPFFILSIGLYTSIQWVRRKRMIGGQIPVAVASVSALVLLARHNILATGVTLLNQTSGGLVKEDITQTIFPYFLMPKGPSFLLGFEPIIAVRPEPWSSICIGLAFLLLITAVVYSLVTLRIGRPTACLFLVMLVVGTRLFLGNNGFGLFKLAMFVTPLLAAALAGLLLGIKPRVARGIIALPFCCIWILVIQVYVQAATPSEGNAFVEINDASVSLGQVPGEAGAMISDIGSSPIAKLAAAVQGKSHLTFLTRHFFSQFSGEVIGIAPPWVWRFMPGPDIPKHAAELSRLVLHRLFVTESAFGTSFMIRNLPIEAYHQGTLLSSRAEYQSFNKLSPIPMPQEGLFSKNAIEARKNHLVFIHSKAGQHFYLGDPGFVAVYKPQPDSYSTTGKFFAIGQRPIFQVLNPSSTVRVRLSMTDSVLGLGRTQLPEQATALGRDDTFSSFGLVGAGSANVYSGPIAPLILNGRAYVALNLKRRPVTYLPGEPTGLNRLYHQEVPLDPRVINGYCRDISLISDEDYRKLARPSQLSRFPDDLLLQPTLEYSGIYEDGWISRRAFVVLGPVQAGQTLVIKGMIPTVPGTPSTDNRAEIRLNGTPVANRVLGVGEFEITCPVNEVAPSLRVDLYFADHRQLPSTDQRPIAALLRSIAVTPAP